MEPVTAAIVALSLVAVAALVGVVIRARSGRRRNERHLADGGIDPRDVELDSLGAVATLVQFSTQFCARCPGVRRALTQRASDEVAVTEVDLTHDTEKASRFHVLQTPTVLVLDAAGVVTARFSGAVRMNELDAALDELKGNSRVTS